MLTGNFFSKHVCVNSPATSDLPVSTKEGLPIVSYVFLLKIKKAGLA
jgi:hypothetical protein